MAGRADTSESIVARLEQFFAVRPEDDIACAYLFGSVARGTARAKSDVDVAVLRAEHANVLAEGGDTDLADAIEAALRRPVDLVILNRAPVDLVHKVLRDGILISERDRSRRIRFEVRARNEYFDLLPYLREYRRPRQAQSGD